MIEEKRVRKCKDLVAYPNKTRAWIDLDGLSEISKRQYKIEQCTICQKWHILHLSYELERGRDH